MIKDEIWGGIVDKFESRIFDTPRIIFFYLTISGKPKAIYMIENILKYRIVLFIQTKCKIMKKIKSKHWNVYVCTPEEMDVVKERNHTANWKKAKD